MVEGINQRLVAHLGDLLNEFLHIGKLAIHGHVADVGHGIDGVQFFNHLLADLAGRYFPQVVPVQFGNDFLHRPVQAVHADGTLFTGFDKAP